MTTNPTDQNVTLVVLDSGDAYCLPGNAYNELSSDWHNGLSDHPIEVNTIGGGVVSFRREQVHHILYSTPESREFANAFLYYPEIVFEPDEGEELM